MGFDRRDVVGQLAEEGVGEGDIAGGDEERAAYCLADWMHVRLVGWEEGG